MKYIFIPLFVFSFCLLFAQQNAQWRGPDRNGIYPDKGLLKEWPEQGPEMLWHFDDLGPGHGSVAVTDSYIYVSGVENDNGFVVAFNHDGNIQWKSIYGSEWMESYDGVRTTPVIVGDHLYILSGYGLLSCMNSQNGELIWQENILKKYNGENLKWGITENLLVYDDKVICTPGGKNHNVIALNRFNGDLIWSTAGMGEISAYNSPTLIVHNQKKIIVTHSEFSIMGIDAGSGQLLWTYNQPNKWSVHANTPIYKDGKLYVVTGYGKGGVMLSLSEDGTSVTEIWTDKNLDNKLGGVVLLGDRIYGSGDFKRKWVCLDWNTGEELYSTKAMRKGNIIAADDLLYWYSQSGDVALVEPTQDSFRIISQFEVPFGKDQHWAHSVIHSKKLFIRHGTSLMVYDIAQEKKTEVKTEWRGPGRTGVYKNETGLLKEWPENGPELIWHNDSIPKGYSSVAIYNGYIFTTGVDDDQDVVIALNEKGEKLWRTSYGRKWDSSYDLSRSTPTIFNNKLYVSSGLGDIACLNVKDGNIIWQVKASDLFEGKYGRWGISESLLLVDDLVIYTPGGDKTTLVAFNAANGDLMWQTEALGETPSYTSPLFTEYNGQKMIITSTENYLLGVSPEDGKLLWQFNIGDYAGGKYKANNQTNTPLFKNGEVFFTSGYDHKSLLLRIDDDLDSISPVWVDSLLDVHHGGVVEIDGYIYGSNWINNRNGEWTCLKWDTGEKMYATTWENKGSVISADGMLYCYEEKNGNLALVPVDPEKFEVVSSFKIPYGKGPHWSHPVISDGRLYIRHINSIMAYNISASNE